MMVRRGIGMRGLGATMPNPANYSSWGDFLNAAELANGVQPGSCNNPLTCDYTFYQSIYQQAVQAWQGLNSPTGSTVQAQAQSNLAAQAAAATMSSPAANVTPRATSPRAPTPFNSGGPPSGGSPSVSFVSSRGGTSLQVGDTWTVKITGGAANAPVTVVFSGSNPSAGKSATVGNTDGTGSFSMSGSALASQVGTYTETWGVGGVPAGAFSFSIAAPAPAGGGSSSTPTNSNGSQNAPGGSQQTTPPPAGACTFALFGETSCIGPIGSTTLLVLGGAAAVLFFMSQGKGGR